MKKSKIIITAIISLAIIAQSCEKQFTRIDGYGPIVSETLQLADFSKINMTGADDVYITFGAEQKVEVEGHRNIINLIKTRVSNSTWEMELRDGNYGSYELTYYITIPSLEKLTNTGSGNVTVMNSSQQDFFELSIIGSGSFYGFPLTSNKVLVDVLGSGLVEVTAVDLLEVKIEGSGNVYYKGNPSILTNVTGSGRIKNSN